MLAETLALLPIGAYQADSTPPLQVDSGASPRQMLDRLHAAWNREADAGEYYHGLYRAGEHRPEGLALLGGRVAVSPVQGTGAPDNSGWFVAHGIAHNFGTGDDAPLAAHATYGAATYGWSSATERFFSPFDREVMVYAEQRRGAVHLARALRAGDVMDEPACECVAAWGRDRTDDRCR